MFEFMHKYRLPILIAIFCGLLGFGVWASIQSLFLGPSNEVIGTFAMPGEAERVEVWSEEYGELWRMFARYGDQWPAFAQQFGLQEQDFGLFVWDFLVLARAATAAGIEVPDAAVERWELMRTGQEAGKDINLPDWYLDFQRKVLAVGQFRSQFTMDPGGTPYPDLLPDYQRAYSTVSAKVILLDKRENDSFVLDLGKEDDKAKLETWFKQNEWVATTNKKPEGVDVEVAYVRLRDQSIDAFKKSFDENWASQTKDMKVTEEDLQARYKTSTFPYQQLAHDEMAKAGVEHEHGSGDQDADYEYLKTAGHLEREIKVARLMSQLQAQVKDKPETLGAVAKDTFKFAVVSLTDAERSALAEQPDFGSLRLSAMVWETGVAKLPKDGAEAAEGDYKLGSLFVDANQPAGGLEAGVFDDPGTMIGLVRMTAHKEERLPEFGEILVELKKEWQTAQARTDLLDRTREFQDAVDAWCVAQLMTDASASEPWSRWTWLSDSAMKVLGSEQYCNQKIEDAIKERELDRANSEHESQIEMIEEQQRRGMKAELADDMDPLQARGYEEIAARMELVPFDFGPVNKATGLTPQYPEGISRQERANRVLRSKSIMNGLSFLDVGKISTMPVDAAGMSVLALVTGRTDPEGAELLMYPDRVRDIASRRRVQPDRGWNYKVFKLASFFDLDAPKTDEGIADAEVADRKRALARQERQRKRNEVRQAAMKKALERKQEEEAKEASEKPAVPDKADKADKADK